MRDSFAPRSGIEYVEKGGTYVQTYPEPVPAWLSALQAEADKWDAPEHKD